VQRPTSSAAAGGWHTEVATPDHLLEAGYAFWRSKLLFSAVELELFTLLGEAPPPVPASIAAALPVMQLFELHALKIDLPSCYRITRARDPLSWVWPFNLAPPAPVEATLLMDSLRIAGCMISPYDPTR
jgi:hypothetical protein